VSIPSLPLKTYGDNGTEAVGVPEMTPVLGSIVSPAGSAGEIEYLTVPVKYFASIASDGTIAAPTLPESTYPDGEISGSKREEMVICAVAVSTLSVAVMVATVVAITFVGVPEMTPVNVFKVNPAGKAGEMEYETVPSKLAATNGALGVIAVPTLAAIHCVDGVMVGKALTVKLTFAVADSLPWVAVTVYSAVAAATVAIPEIIPVVAFKTSPVGSAGEIV